MVNMTTPKGMNDYLPEEQILKQQVLDALRQIFEKYGFSPLETPALEKYDTLTVKGAGGTEVGKEIFTLKDRGGRKLGLRFDLTVPLARVVASNPNLPLPFKRYQMEKVWRQEFGTRTREFWQCDVDTIGSSDPLSDAEMLSITQDVFKTLGIKVNIKFNSRALIRKVLNQVNIPEKDQVLLIMEIDKLDKGTGDVPPKVLRAIEMAKVTDEPYLAELSKLLKKLGVRAEFDATLARGLEYYTGPIFEVVSEEYKYSLGGGGRYDKLLKQLGGRDLPATGISFGVTRICEVLSKKLQKKKTITQLFVVPIAGTKLEAAKLAIELRNAGIKTEVDLASRSPSKNLAYANRLGIPYVLFVGPEELKKNKFKLKDMNSGKESLLTIRQLINIF